MQFLPALPVHKELFIACCLYEPARVTEMAVLTEVSAINMFSA
jgi:hypothetical protein